MVVKAWRARVKQKNIMRAGVAIGIAGALGTMVRHACAKLICLALKAIVGNRGRVHSHS